MPIKLHFLKKISNNEYCTLPELNYNPKFKFKIANIIV